MPVRSTIRLGCALCLAAALAVAPAQAVVIAAVGDIMLGGRGTAVFQQQGYDYPFAATAPLLRSVDLAVGNLEAPITRRGTEYRAKRFRFRTDPRTAAALKGAGFSVLTLANNHLLDFGPEGLRDTVGALAEQGIGFCGAGDDLATARRPALVTAGGVKIAVLAYSLTQPTEFFAGPRRPGTAPALAGLVAEDIRSARGVAEYVVISFHWGRELAEHPSAAQQRLGRLAVDAGADLVIGHHPHVLQGVERYRNGIILYSLGNFAFGSRSDRAQKSVIARVTLDKETREVEFIPLDVRNGRVRYQPRPLIGAAGEAVIGELNRLSAPFGTRIVASSGRYLLEPAPTRTAWKTERR